MADANTTIIPTYAKNDDHDAYSSYRWNKRKKNTNLGTTERTSTTCLANTSSQTTAYAPIKILVKDDPSVSPTIETLCTLDTCSLHSTNIDNDAILSIPFEINQ